MASSSYDPHALNSSWTIARLRCRPRTPWGRIRRLGVADHRRFLSAGGGTTGRGARSCWGSGRRVSRWGSAFDRWGSAFDRRARLGVGWPERDGRPQCDRRLRRLARFLRRRHCRALVAAMTSGAARSKLLRWLLGSRDLKLEDHVMRSQPTSSSARSGPTAANGRVTDDQ